MYDLSRILLNGNLSWSNWSSPLHLNHAFIPDKPYEIFTLILITVNFEQQIRIINNKLNTLKLDSQSDKVQVLVLSPCPLLPIFTIILHDGLWPAKLEPIRGLQLCLRQIQHYNKIFLVSVHDHLWFGATRGLFLLDFDLKLIFSHLVGFLIVNSTKHLSYNDSGILICQLELSRNGRFVNICGQRLQVTIFYDFFQIKFIVHDLLIIIVVIKFSEIEQLIILTNMQKQFDLNAVCLRSDQQRSLNSDHPVAVKRA